jgi:flagellar biosynthetic protein FliP
MNPAALSMLTGPLKGTEMATVMEIFILLTLLSVAPLVLVTLTSFTRIVIVLSFLRQALGTQQSPSNQIIIALSLFLSFHVMAPVWQKIEAESVTPYYNRQIQPQVALERAWAPLREFLAKQTRKADLALFKRNSDEKAVVAIDAIGAIDAMDATQYPASSLIPAFVISELKTAFQMAFLIYIPFLVLDLVVASILMSMGMMFLPPVLISLPFKLVLFVLVDGWNLLVGSLVRSFA